LCLWWYLLNCNFVQFVVVVGVLEKISHPMRKVHLTINTTNHKQKQQKETEERIDESLMFRKTKRAVPFD
jgi:hypothetical protein